MKAVAGGSFGRWGGHRMSAGEDVLSPQFSGDR